MGKTKSKDAPVFSATKRASTIANGHASVSDRTCASTASKLPGSKARGLSFSRGDFYCERRDVLF